MSQLILARGTPFKKNFLKKLFPNLEFGPYFLVFSLILFVVLVTVITLMFSTRQVTKGYVLSKLERDHQELVKEREQQDMEISKVRSLNYIQQSSKVKRMKKADQLVYLEGDSAIASK